MHFECNNICSEGEAPRATLFDTVCNTFVYHGDDEDHVQALSVLPPTLARQKKVMGAQVPKCPLLIRFIWPESLSIREIGVMLPFCRKQHVAHACKYATSAWVSYKLVL